MLWRLNGSLPIDKQRDVSAVLSALVAFIPILFVSLYSRPDSGDYGDR